MELDIDKIHHITNSLATYLQGKERPLSLSLISFFSRGHLLIEDLPGLGKTTLAIGIAKSLDLTFGRIQCTSDLLPTDITGLSIYNKTSGEFDFHPGPIFNNIVLCDEINRATPKTQSALLEAMEEKQVTIEGKTYKLPRIFCVIATQNPAEQFGTFPLPESQLDRFMMKISIGYPSNPSYFSFRVTMERMDESKLYWRGVTLDYFDGTSWSGTRKGGHSPVKGVPPAGKRVNQTIYLEPYDNSSLFALDKPIYIDLKGVKKHDDMTFGMPSYREKRVRYTAFSIMSDTLPEDAIDTAKYLQLPANLSPLVQSLAKSLAVKDDKGATIKRIMSHLNSDRYSYTLKGLPRSANPLESFFFDSPSGNCEYFASAMAVLLRVNNIPSRIVGGYRGGYFNEMGNYYLIPQKNAHVWVEAHISGRGWVRIDPTPATLETFSSGLRQGIFLKFQLFCDMINYYWYGIVLTYNLERQLTIARFILTEFKKPSLSIGFLKSGTAKYTGVGIIIGLLMITIAILSRSAKPREITILNRFLHKLDTMGYRKGASEGLEEFAARIPDKNLQKNSMEFVRNFENTYYTDRPFMTQDLQRLENIIKKIDDA